MRTLKYWQAISEATVQSMRHDPHVFVCGIGVDDFKGIFGTTRDAFLEFGVNRVIDIPNCENAFAGITIGAAAVGKRPLVVHPRNDFMFLATDQLVNLAAKWSYMFAGKSHVPVVVRGIVGRGWGQGATHSQSLHALFGHFPGLVVSCPANAYDAKGLLITALRGRSPVVILENRALYEHATEVPEEPYEIPFGQARIARKGEDVTIVATSLMVHEALRASEMLEARGISAEVVDPRTVRPLDDAAIVASVRKTGRLVVADTSWARFGFAAEVAAIAAEQAAPSLKASVVRVTIADCPAPVSKPLEDLFHPNPNRIVEACLQTMGSSDALKERARDVQEAFAGPY